MRIKQQWKRPREAYEALTDAQKQYVTEETVAALEALENRIQELEDAEEPEQAYVTVAIEKFTIGQGYLVEPVLVEITEGESTAQILDRVLGKNGLRYDNTGSVDSSFYLSWILDEKGSLTAEFPEVSLQHAEEQGITITNPRRRATLGEFDYTNQSGWMYTLNNDMPNVGMSDTEPKDGDVIRIRFTAMKGDLCSGNGYVDDPFVPDVNGDSITKLLAEFNSSENRKELMGYENVREAYENAVAAISNIANTQETVDAAEAAFKEAVANPGNPEEPEVPVEAQAVMDLISQIGEVTLDSEEAIRGARDAYNALTEEQKGYVTNYEVLEQAENTLADLLTQTDADKAAAFNTDLLIYDIGAVTLESKEAIETARASYKALTDTQKELVTALPILEAAETRYAELLAQQEADQAAADAVTEQICALPSLEALTLDNREQVEAARAAYEDLTDTQKTMVAEETLESLAGLEARIAELLDEEAIIQVEEEISQLPAPEELTLEHAGAVDTAKAHYDALSKEQKDALPQEIIDKLQAAEDRINVLKSEAADQETAHQVIDQIAALPEPDQITFAAAEAVSTARAAYDDLTEAQKAYVDSDTLAKLEALETALSPAAGAGRPGCICHTVTA